MNKYTLEFCRELAKKKSGKCSSLTYTNDSTPLEWECSKGHKWKASLSNVFHNNTWCKQCHFLKSRISIEQYKSNLYSVHGNEISLDEKTYISTHTKAKFIDKDYGEFYSMPYRITGGGRHPQRKKNTLSKLYKLKESTIIKKLNRLKIPISIKYETYVNNGIKCIFVDKLYGEWSARPQHVFRGKALHPKRSLELRKKTNLKKYGVEASCQNKKIALKVAKSSNNSCVLYHWKTKEELICVASYEIATVKWLNNNNIDFDWQPKVFETPLKTPKGNRCTYRPDLYLIDEDKWVEIKGYFRENSKNKWLWFHKEFPNSELWDKKKLKELHIL